MDQIFDNLYVGDVNDADNPKKHRQNNIEYILNLSGTSTESDTAPGYKTVKEKNYFHIPLADGPENTDFMLKQAIKLGNRLHEKAMDDGESLLVHCSVGASRSVSIGAALMSLQNERRVEENVERIQKVRPVANPEENLLSQVNRLTADIYNEE